MTVVRFSSQQSDEKKTVKHVFPRLGSTICYSLIRVFSVSAPPADSCSRSEVIRWGGGGPSPPPRRQSRRELSRAVNVSLSCGPLSAGRRTLRLYDVSTPPARARRRHQVSTSRPPGRAVMMASERALVAGGTSAL